MEYIFAGNGYRTVIYDEGNNIFSTVIGKNRIQKIRLLGKDYHRSLTCAKQSEIIHCAYISTAGALVWVDGEKEISVVLFEDRQEQWNIENPQLMYFGKKLVLLYMATNPVTGRYEVRYIPLPDDRKTRVLIESKKAIKKVKQVSDGLLCCSGKETADKTIYSIRMQGQWEIESEKMELYAEGYMKNREEKIIEGYRERYMELYEFTKKLQEEGKQWREKFYASHKRSQSGE